MEPSYDIDPIVLKYVRDRSLSADEAARLRQWLAESGDRKEIIDRMRDDPDWVLEQLHRMQEVRTEAIWSKVESRITSQQTSIPLTSRTGRRWWLYTAAASIMVICVGGWFWYSHVNHRPAIAPAAPVAAATDVKPGGNRAILTLADGRRIDLGATANGVLANQGNTKVAKLSDGQLAYNLAYNKDKTAEAKPPTVIAYNSLSTPRAGQFTLRLPDGTQVWLNNASVLKYPVAFTGADREVELTGEAYFEVARDPAHPFHVKVQNGPTVDVLGTSFNVMAYSDEPTERTTLIDGSIRVTQNNQSVELNHEQQSSLDAQGKLRVTPDINVQEVIAWKNGYFHFDNSSLQTTMRQLARWYDIDVEYQGQLPEHVFSGKIQRNLSLMDILKNLETEQVHFKLEGRKLLVTP